MDQRSVPAQRETVPSRAGSPGGGDPPAGKTLLRDGPRDPLRALLGIYKVISITGILPMSCRFFPTCSSYSAQALKKWGLLRGTFLGLRRILRCHPGFPGGFDPVP
ncbi:MAG: membrane protein insertion efficiency factor YidD [Candidatus Omnitrophica bacterium]|nr:membrane protein insertion efficiency factor YidD [Candidatus Omnitrophota bacterium]